MNTPNAIGSYLRLFYVAQQNFLLASQEDKQLAMRKLKVKKTPKKSTIESQ